MIQADDVDRIMAIMSAAFEPEFGEAWTRRQVEDALLVGNCHAFLAGDTGAPALPGERAVGFSLSRTGYEEEELLLFAVLPNYRAHGIGRAILDTLSLSASRRGAKRLLLEMRRGNPAESLYRTFGFTLIGERKDYYRTPLGTRIDALTFACELIA
jgi:ribosomal-protein-alanine N-acetyltransferase